MDRLRDDEKPLTFDACKSPNEDAREVRVELVLPCNNDDFAQGSLTHRASSDIGGAA